MLSNTVTDRCPGDVQVMSFMQDHEFDSHSHSNSERQYVALQQLTLTLSLSREHGPAMLMCPQDYQ